MPYKIVQTYEGKKFKLTTVPSGWESDNVLKYPKKAILKYAKDENSIPQPDWEVMICKVKRHNIATYEDGENLITDMVTRGDTDDDNYHRQKQCRTNQEALKCKIVSDKIIKPRRTQTSQQTLNLNDVAETMVGSIVYFENPQENLTNSTITSAAVLPENIYTANDLYETKNPAVQETISIDIDKISDNQKQMLEYQKQILDNQATLMSVMTENQTKLMDSTTAILGHIQSLKNIQNVVIEKVSGLSVQLEDAVFQISGINNREVVNLKDSKDHLDNIPFHIKPVDSPRELDDLEKQLSDYNIRNRLKNTYSIICSKGGKGIDCAYTLVDIMFTRAFISQCSWSGGSRGDDLKVALKGYKHVLSFFWEMIHFWDENYTLKDNETFLKTILKNSHKRKLAKCERASTSRTRSKSCQIKRKKVTKSDNEINQGGNLSQVRHTEKERNQAVSEKDESENKQAENDRDQTGNGDDESDNIQAEKEKHQSDNEHDEEQIDNRKDESENKLAEKKTNQIDNGHEDLRNQKDHEEDEEGEQDENKN